MRAIALLSVVSSLLLTKGIDGEVVPHQEAGENDVSTTTSRENAASILNPGLRLLQDGGEPMDGYTEFDYDDDDDDDDNGADGFETCDMACENGGSCELLQLKSDMHKHTMLQKCNCPTGYGGILCEKEVDVCFKAYGKDRYCQNEAPCRIANGKAFCNCKEAYYISAFAGLDCSYPASEYCTDSGRMSHKAYCVNGGACKTYVGDKEAHPGCNCEKGYKGDHCEYLKGEGEIDLSESSSSSSSSFTGHKWFLAFLIILYVASLAVLLIMVRRWRERTLAERAIVEKANFVTSELTMRCMDVPAPPPSSFAHSSFDTDTLPLAPGQESKELNENMSDLL